MAALMECVMSDLEDIIDSNNPDLDILPENLVELAAAFDIDIDAISAVEGSWERVDVGDCRSPRIEGVFGDVFVSDRKSVYEYDDYMIVRGREEAHHVYFAYERTV